MEKVIIGLAIVVLIVVGVVFLLRSRRLTESEQDFVSFVQDQAKMRNLTKEDMYRFVFEEFERLCILYAINGPLILNDVPRLQKIIIDTYRTA